MDGASCALCSECPHKSLFIFLSVLSVLPALLGVISAFLEEADLQRLLLTEFSGCAPGGWMCPPPRILAFQLCFSVVVGNWKEVSINASSEKSPDDRRDETDTGVKNCQIPFIL